MDDDRFIFGIVLECFYLCDILNRKIAVRSMLKLFMLVSLLLFAACQSSPPAVLPTVAQLPTLAGTSSSQGGDATVESESSGEIADADQPSVESSLAPEESPTVSPFPTATNTRPPTNTPFPTRTPVIRPTLEPTQAAIATITAQPVLSVPTAAPGATADTSQLVADVVITQAQFQEEIDLLIEDSVDIQSATIDFRPDGINVLLTASGGQAMITGNVLFGVTVASSVNNPSSSFIIIQVLDIRSNAPEVPEAYVNIIGGPLFEAFRAALDGLLSARLGPEHNLENVVMTHDAMLITLLVPNE